MNKTDWARYYSNPAPTAVWSRTVIRKHLLKMLRQTGIRQNSSIAELGGGGSCFCDAVESAFGTGNYTVYDSCREGIAEFLRKKPLRNAILADLLYLQTDVRYDLVFSVGLIEHFSPEETEKIIQKHFELVKPGGHVVFFFPTPTLLYRVTRKIAEIFKLWQFPDERPILPDELNAAAQKSGTCLKEYTIYANFLTQHTAVYRKWKHEHVEHL